MAEAFRVVEVSQEVIEVSGSRELFSLLETWRTVPVLVLIKMEMAEMDGLQLQAKLCEEFGFNNSIRIVISRNEDHRAKAIHAGANGFYLKPSILDQYLAIARELRNLYLR